MRMSGCGSGQDASPGAISCALLDVGGTLWPEKAPLASDDARLGRLRRVLPALSHAAIRGLLARIDAEMAELDRSLTQDTDGTIRRAGRECVPPVEDAAVAAIRRALCLPARGRFILFDGARDLLATTKELQLSCVIVSNAVVRDEGAYRRDFADLGVSQWIDGIVSSVDVGYRKPHRRIFEAALARARASPAACVVIGNSERNDVEPALALGMRAIRVAIEEPPPASSAAHAVACSLGEGAAVLRAWAAGGRSSVVVESERGGGKARSFEGFC